MDHTRLHRLWWAPITARQHSLMQEYGTGQSLLVTGWLSDRKVRYGLNCDFSCEKRELNRTNEFDDLWGIFLNKF